MDVADRIRPREIQEIVVAAHLAVPGVEARATEFLLLQLQRLDHGAHGAVEHQDALRRELAEPGFDGGDVCWHAHAKRSSLSITLRARSSSAKADDPVPPEGRERHDRSSPQRRWLLDARL